MVFDICKNKTPENSAPGGGRNVSFEPLRPCEEEDFLLFMEKEFPGSWHGQFLHLHNLGLLDCRKVLIMKYYGNISGFAGPFSISECGNTCGIGPGIARDLRGKGLGLALLNGIIRFVRDAGGKKITLFGAVDKINFYGKAGFVPGPVHLVMEKNLKRSS